MGSMDGKFKYRNPKTGKAEDRPLYPSAWEKTLEVVRDSEAIDKQRDEILRSPAKTRK